MLKEIEAVAASSIFNLGNLLVPFIVSITCILGFFLAYKLPKNFTPKVIAEELKRNDPSLDISSVIEADEEKEEKSEILFVQIGLWVLSGSIFGFIWSAFLMKAIKAVSSKFNAALFWIASALIPFASVYALIKMRKAILDAAKESGMDMKISMPLLLAFAVIFPILPVNFVSLAILQHKMNKLNEYKEA